jgi:hypothetical protein
VTTILPAARIRSSTPAPGSRNAERLRLLRVVGRELFTGVA